MDAEFLELVAPHRRELLVHCYRILGSFHDAEDLLQETLVRAWRGLGSLEERAAARAWLYKIATRACLDALERSGGRGRSLPLSVLEPGDPEAPLPEASTEMLWLEPLPDA